MTTLQKIVKEAKALRKKYPKKYAKWTDYVKAASKKISGLDKVTKTGNKTTVHYTKKAPATKKKAAPKKAVQSSLFGVKKKAAPRSTHKDTKSHNVNIRVVSGVNDIANKALQKIKQNNDSIASLKQSIARNKETVKNKMAANTPFWKTWYTKHNKAMSDYIKTLQKENTQLKKHIK
jgi:hypothetical protein